jgi:protein gp37
MSEHTGISWTDHTFNPWWGCVKVSPACTNCYAERDSKRYGFNVWGPGSDRRFFGDDHWKEPLKWNRKAKDAGVRRRVFCASMADVFEVPIYQNGEGREMRERLERERARLWRLIEATPSLDWLLLTKRPEQILNRTPTWWLGQFPSNVWIGTTAETQGWLEARIEALLGVSSPVVRFLSYEPALGPINLRRVRLNSQIHDVYVDALTGCHEGPITAVPLPKRKPSIDWVIAGGESGAGARPSHPEWFRAVRDQCAAIGTPFFFKQNGEYVESPAGTEMSFTSPDGIRMPKTIPIARPFGVDGPRLIRIGKRAAGALLDGREWKQFPMEATR